MSSRVLRLGIAMLWVAVLASSLAVVYERHRARSHFVELQRLNAERDQLDVEWGQLQLEQSTWATHGRVESVARDELGMVIPPATDLRMVRP